MAQARLLSDLTAAALAAAVWAGPSALAAQTVPDRLAVVVGNQDYDRITDLGNARSDAERMAALLRDMGFTVFDAYDVTRQGFEEVMRRAILNADDETEIVFFYAGHGIQIGRRNYLLPTDVAFESIYDLPVESVTLDRVIEQLSSQGTVHVAIIDACRDNPFPDTVLAGNLDASLFETKSGFDVFQTPINSLVAFSTAPGMVAFDGEDGQNSPYTSAILTAVAEAPDAEAQTLFSRVRATVYTATDGKQVPWESSTLVRPFRFLSDDLGQSGALLAQATESGAQVTRESQETVALPDAVALTLEYDRDMALDDALSRALGNAGSVDVSILDQPTEGLLAIGAAGGLVYRPALSERRSDMRTLVLQDAFTLSVDAGAGPQRVSVTLDMPVNACDLAAGDALDPDGVGYYRLPNELEVDHAMAACDAAFAAAPETTRFQYQLGRAQQAAGEYEAAFASFEAAAEAGHTRALNATARLLTARQLDRDLFDVPQDRDRANALLERGIDAGDPFAMHSLGQELLRNADQQAARERGFDLLDRAAELGHTYSMNELGVYFLTKDTDHYIPERGMRYLEASAARNDIYGYHNLGFVALFGLRDGTVDHAAAYDWFEKAALGGHPRSPATLGRMIVRGQAPGKTAADAVAWYDMGLARGDAWGGVNAANMVLNGDVSGIDTAQALIRAAKALHLPDADAAEAARGLLAGQSARDLGRAVQTLLNELGQSVAVDGKVGPQTRGAIAALVARYGIPAPADDGLAQLSALAKAYWAENPVRSDVF